MSTHRNARLSPEQCVEIRALAANTCECCGRKLTLRNIGDRFGVSAVAIYRVLHTRRWGEPA